MSFKCSFSNVEKNRVAIHTQSSIQTAAVAANLQNHKTTSGV